jgi:hypothetical protein
VDILTFVRAQWDRVLAVVAVAGALITLIAGWVGISGTAHVAEQLPYVISCGIAGLIYITIAATLWLSADLRDEWRELRILRLAHEADRRAAANHVMHDGQDGHLESTFAAPAALARPHIVQSSR